MAPDATKSWVINIIIDPTPATTPYLKGLEAIAVKPSHAAKQKFLPLKAIWIYAI